MEGLSTEFIVLVAALAAVVGMWFWSQMRPSHRVRRNLERAEARARAMPRH